MIDVRRTIDELGGPKVVAERLRDEFGEPKPATVAMWSYRKQVPKRWLPALRDLVRQTGEAA